MAKYDDVVPQLITLLEDFTQAWDTEPDNGMTAETRLLADIGFESVDVIQLTVAIEEQFALQKTPFDKLLMKDGRYVDDLSIGQIARFLSDYLPD